MHGNRTQRRLEPYQLVTTGRRWYLLAFDRDRQDWRSLRLDRMADVRALGSTFTPRQAPDAAAYVRRSISASPYQYVARVRYQAPEDVVAQTSPRRRSTSSRTAATACIVTVGADDPERMVFYLAHAGVRVRGAGAARGGPGGRRGRRAAAPCGWLAGGADWRCREVAPRPRRWWRWPRWKTSKRASRRWKHPRLTTAAVLASGERTRRNSARPRAPSHSVSKARHVTQGSGRSRQSWPTFAPRHGAGSVRSMSNSPRSRI